jgi:hypothetical protein
MIILAVAVDSGDPGWNPSKTFRVLWSLTGTVPCSLTRCVPEERLNLGGEDHQLILLIKSKKKTQTNIRKGIDQPSPSEEGFSF